MGSLSVCSRLQKVGPLIPNPHPPRLSELLRVFPTDPRWGCSSAAPLSWANPCRNSVCPTPRPTSSSSSTRRISEGIKDTKDGGALLDSTLTASDPKFAVVAQNWRNTLFFFLHIVVPFSCFAAVRRGRLQKGLFFITDSAQSFREAANLPSKNTSEFSFVLFYVADIAA